MISIKISLAFEDLGLRLFTKLRGEWALLIWDRRERKLLAARDVVGCRPLFWQRSGGRLFLATEIRQVMAGSRAEARCNPGAAADIHLVRYPEARAHRIRGRPAGTGGVARSFHPSIEDPTTNDVGFWSPPSVDRRKRDSRELVEEVRGLVDSAVKRAVPATGAAVPFAVLPARTSGSNRIRPAQAFTLAKGRTIWQRRSI